MPCLLESSDRADCGRTSSRVPANLMHETNRAHALMFLGQETQASAVYTAHKGEHLSNMNDKLWERAIAEDFAQFRKAGLAPPMMDDIEKQLCVAP